MQTWPEECEPEISNAKTKCPNYCKKYKIYKSGKEYPCSKLKQYKEYGDCDEKKTNAKTECREEHNQFC